MKIDNRYIWLLPFLIILSKWVIIFYTYRGFDFEFVILSNFNDISYFPFILSLSELNLSPTFNEYFSTEKLITFPIASMFFHALFYKIFGLISYIFLEIIFVTLAYVLIYYLFKEIGFKEKSIILGTIFFFFITSFFEFFKFF